MDERKTVEEVVQSLLVTDNAKRDELLTQGLYPWRVQQLREIQAEWNQRAMELRQVADYWQLNEIVAVLIGLEHEKLFQKAKRATD